MEREELLKKNLYELDADVVGLQEVVFGEKQLLELAHPHMKRHNINLDSLKSTRSQGYTPFPAPVQLPIFHYMSHPDPNAALDGNALLVDADSE